MGYPPNYFANILATCCQLSTYRLPGFSIGLPTTCIYFQVKHFTIKLISQELDIGHPPNYFANILATFCQLSTYRLPGFSIGLPTTFIYFQVKHFFNNLTSTEIYTVSLPNAFAIFLATCCQLSTYRLPGFSIGLPTTCIYFQVTHFTIKLISQELDMGYSPNYFANILGTCCQLSTYRLPGFSIGLPTTCIYFQVTHF